MMNKQTEYPPLEAQKIYEELIIDFINAEIPIDQKHICKTLKYNNSVTKLGSCKKDGDYYMITLSKNAMNDKEQIRNTLAHELVHTLPGCMNHGVKFHRYGAMVYKKLGIVITGRASRAEAEQSGISDAYVEYAKYKVVCNTCGNTIYRQKKSRLIMNPGSYRCGKCGGTLKVYVKKPRRS